MQPDGMVPVLTGRTDDGFDWTLHSGYESPDELMTTLEVRKGTSHGRGGFGGPPLYTGDPTNYWIGTRTGQPTFLAIRADPRVVAVDVVGRDDVVRLSMSEVHSSFGLRFGVLRLRDGTQVLGVRPVEPV